MVHHVAALPEWLRGMPAKCMRKRAKVRTLQAAEIFNLLTRFSDNELWRLLPDQKPCCNLLQGKSGGQVLLQGRPASRLGRQPEEKALARHADALGEIKVFQLTIRRVTRIIICWPLKMLSTLTHM